MQVVAAYPRLEFRIRNSLLEGFGNERGNRGERGTNDLARRAIRINPRDNVATVTEEVSKGDEVAVATGRETETLVAEENIPLNFKIAMEDITLGQPILKYGEFIGEASAEIPRGSLVHRHNLVGRRGSGAVR